MLELNDDCPESTGSEISKEPGELVQLQAKVPTGSKSAIIIDDSKLIQMRMKQLLQSMGFEVPAVAADGAIGIELVKEFAPHLIIMDYEMPVMGGVKAIEAIRETKLDTKILVISGTMSSARVKEMKRAGADGILAKPIDLFSFYRVMKELGV
jgi:DNA-binding NarL/FixJ family response regulator